MTNAFAVVAAIGFGLSDLSLAVFEARLTGIIFVSFLLRDTRGCIDLMHELKPLQSLSTCSPKAKQRLTSVRGSSMIQR